MIMKRISLVFLMFLLMMPHMANSQVRMLTLQECVDTALINNRSIKQQQLNRESRMLAYEQARMNLLPNLNASAGQSFMLGRSLTVDNTYQNINSSQSSFNISSGVTLFDGMRMKYNIDARRSEMKASEADLEKIESDIQLNVTVAFLQVLLFKENLANVAAQLELTQQRIDQMSALVLSGKQPEGELLALKAQLAREELNLTQADNQVKLALLDLAQIVELKDFQQIDVMVPEELLESELALLSANEVYQSALLSRPEIKGAEYRLMGNMTNVEIARSAYLPTLNFGVQMGTGYYNLSGRPNNAFNRQLQDNLSTNMGFNLQIPIFNKFDTRNRVSGAKLAVESSRIDIENAKIQLRKTVEQAYQNAIAAQSRLKAAEKSSVASREAFRYAEQKYEAGRASVYELYQAKANLNQVISEMTQARYEYILRIKVLEQLR